MRNLFLVVLLVLAQLSCASIHTLSTLSTYPPAPAACSSPQAGGGGTNCTNRPDTIPVHTDAPVFVSNVTNGKRYLGGSGNDTFHVVHLYSETDNLYEMGYALGQMFPKEIHDMWDTIAPWLASYLASSSDLPSWLSKLVVKYGAPAALDLVYDITKDYIPKEYLDEWQGIADGANCSVKRVRYVSLFPQLSKAACTILVGHKDATKDGGVNHLRALDFNASSHVADFASVVIYHYKNKPKLANFGWLAMTGVLTGMNSVPMSVGEKMWGGHNTPGLGLPSGLPWMQMLRKSLELDDLTKVEKYIRSVSKPVPDSNSVSIHLGFGDQKANDVVGFEVGYNFSKQFNSTTHRAAPTHPLFKNLVYWSKNDDARTMCVADMLTARYGNIDAEWMAMYYSPNDKTGDTQMVAMDLQAMKVWYANSRKSWVDHSTSLCAYYRQRTVLDMAALFNETLA